MTQVYTVALKPSSPADADWWRQAVIYQVYPRSFADSDGNGLGDLNGIRDKADYLAALGVDGVWLSPFYPSALADGGYDVDDYRDVDPSLGTLEDFDELVAALHSRGIKVIVDIVPNHTSNRHAWFVEALEAGPGSDARDRYIFRDGTGDDGSEPPSDWQSAFGGPAWTRVPDGQWYLHLFTVEQPDLNWNNRDVRDDFLQTLRFWSDRGVDGFRVDVANALAKDMSEPLAPWETLGSLESLFDAEEGGPDGMHPLFDRDEVHEIYAEWRGVFNSYDPPRMAVAEAWVPAHRRPRYASAEGLGQAFNFDLLTAPWEAESFTRIITDNLALAAQSGSSSTWVLSNHDVIRHATRYGIRAPEGEEPQEITFGSWIRQPVDRRVGGNRARAATQLLLALPGSTYIYQGEELGLFEVSDIPDDLRQDPLFFRSNGERAGRDGCRVPLPWTTSPPSYGFSTAPAHLPQPDWFAGFAVSRQEHDPASTLTFYRRAILIRRELQGQETLDWIERSPGVVHFTRPGGWHSFTNFGPGEVELPDGEILLASQPLRGRAVPADTTVWFTSNTQ
jgi:alpha-glucosidase